MSPPVRRARLAHLPFLPRTVPCKNALFDYTYPQARFMIISHSKERMEFEFVLKKFND